MQPECFSNTLLQSLPDGTRDPHLPARLIASRRRARSYNKSAVVPRARLAKANRKTEPLKLRIKVPHAATSALADIQAAVLDVLQGEARGAAASADGAGSASSSMSSEFGDVLVQPGSVELQLCRFTDSGLELLVKVRTCMPCCWCMCV